MKNKYSQEKVQSIMESLGGLQPAAAPDFFYTRLKAKMQPEEEMKTFFILRPVFITAMLSVFLIVNVFSLATIKKEQQEPASLQIDNPATIESFAKAYDLNAESVYE